MSKRVFAIASVAVLSAFSAQAGAQTRTLIHDGQNAGEVNQGPNGEDLPARQIGAGGEHDGLVQLKSGMLFGSFTGSFTDMGGAVDGTAGVPGPGGVIIQPGPGRSQAALFAGTLDERGALSMNMPPQYATANVGNRGRNGMRTDVSAVCNGTAALLTYNFAPVNNAIRYGQVWNANGRMSEQTAIMAKTNDNLAATIPGAWWNVSDSDTRTVQIACGGGNGNGADDGWCWTQEVTCNGNTATIAKLADISIESNEQRTRPAIIGFASDPTVTYVFHSAGNSQPTRAGVVASALRVDPTTGAITKLWSKVVQDTATGVLMDKQTEQVLEGVYANRAQFTAGADGIAIATWQHQSDLRRRGRGVTTPVVAAFRLSPEGMEMIAPPQNGMLGGLDATHIVQCPITCGATSAAAMISTSINGNSRAVGTGQVVYMDNGTLREGQPFSLGSAHDNGHLSNLYGENPGNQGRNFAACQEISNPKTGQKMLAFLGNPRRVDPVTGVRDPKLSVELVTIPTAQICPAGFGGTSDKGGAGDLTGCGCNGTNPQSGIAMLLFVALAVFGMRNQRRRA